MTLKLNEKYIRTTVSTEELEAIKPEVAAAFDSVKNNTGKGNDFTGWFTLPVDYDKEEFARIKDAAKRVREDADVFIVIGIGGSYLGARAAIEYVCGVNHNETREQGRPAIYFAGNSISPSYLNDLLKICEGKSVYVNVISKSGTTTEPAVAFRVFRELLEKRYGVEESKKRIFATTDKCRGKLKELSDANGYETFVVPDNVGGRYSVLTAVGLLPIAVAGIDIDAMMQGALDSKNAMAEADFDNNEAMKYAAYRNLMYRAGKTTEILVSYEPAATMLNEWWKQLYGESEGKENKGLYPASVVFSTDLHSLGQYIQEGKRNLFETVVDIKNTDVDVEIPYDEKDPDGLNYLCERGCKVHEINQTAMKATIYAHMDGGVPNLVIEVADRSAYTFGYMVYFFELACAVSGYTLGVNPFDQPGVEAYKKNMFALLDKPDPKLDELKAQLKARMAE